MQTQKYILSILLSIILPVSAIASDVTTHRTQVMRGQSMPITTLSTIADLSSARDQQGKSVSLTEEVYTVGSLTQTTISIVSSNGGGAHGVITLDLFKR